jgi:hypothetical protein
MKIVEFFLIIWGKLSELEPNLLTRLRSGAKKLWLRLQQKVAAPPAPAPALAPQH